MLTGLGGRITALLLAAALVGFAVVVRVWLAATGSYSQGGIAVPLRIASAAALLGGLLLAALAVAWPMRRAGALGKRREKRDGPDSSLPKDLEGGEGP